LIFERNAFFYVMSVVGSFAITLRWSWHIMPTWLRIPLSVPVIGFVASLAYVALR
jgi:hypothetical protein